MGAEKRTRDAVETTCNMVSGLCINCVITYFLFGVSPQFAIGASMIYFTVSWTRTYIVRRIFRHLEE